MVDSNGRRLASPLAALLAGVIALASPAAGARPSDLQGTRSMGMGGALRASAAGDAAVLLNPAGMSLSRQYIVRALYQYRASDAGSQVSAAIVDSVTSRLAAGIFYNFTHASPEQTLRLRSGKTLTLEETINTHEAGLALSYPLGSIVMLGVSGKYVKSTSELPDKTPKEVQGVDISTVTMDAGAIFTITPALSAAVVGYNLVTVDDARYPRLLGLGISYRLGSPLLIEFDSVIDFTSDPDEVTASFHGGAELFLGGRYALRAGAMHDMLRATTYVTGGFGIVTRRLGVSMGLRQMVDGGSETLLAFSVGLYIQ